MSAFPTALSIMVSFLSAVTLLGTPSEIYIYGTMYCYQGISWMIASIVTALVFAPKFREMKFISVYEYLEKRFDRAVRISVSLTYSLIMFIYMALVLYGPALAFSQTSGLNIWLSVVSIGVICTFYSSVGGMKAVIWTDVLQAIVIAVGLLAVAIQGLIILGGFKRTFSIASRGGRIEFDSISFDPRTRHTIWSLLIGGSINLLATYGFNQAQVQRYMSIRSTHGTKQALYINAVGSAFVVFFSALIGVIIYAYYADCDPYTRKEIEDIDQILPYFVMEVLSDKKGLPGVFLACIFSGSLSTISSGLNSLSAVIIEDIYKGLLNRQLTDERQEGPIMGVFVLGFLFPRANRRGGLVGFFASLLFLLWIFLGAQITKKQMKNVGLPLSIANCSDTTNTNWTITTTIMSTSLKRDPLIDLYSISYMWYTSIAVGTVVLVGNIVSYLTHPLQPHEIDPKLIIPVSDVCCCFLPERWREWLRCGVDYEIYHKRQNNNNEVEMTTTHTDGTNHTNSSAQILNTNSKKLIRSNTVSPVPIVFSPSVPSTVNEAHENSSAN
ncbi:unnamed protein product [Rotaria sordida]|uniref:Sodium-coupled monocarboxylate transporter 1 n=1 Tax=Rotaria sordida TaxID=392033 RepID=A0A814GLE5_9BILA|nr:unnamed protein product [Rotaria sordida]